MVDLLFDRVLGRENICNLNKIANTLVRGLLDSRHFILYGRRNTGKTSLLQSIVVPEYLKMKKKVIPVYIDLLGVKTAEDICHRFSLALQEGLTKKYPTQTKLKGIVKGLFRLQPRVAMDPNSGELSVSFGIQPHESATLQSLFEHMVKLHRDRGIVLIMDEFQDIANVDQFDARLRSHLQQLPKMPIVILGSKKHLLANLFAKHGAPLSGWGEDVEMPAICAEEYAPYLNERFKAKRLHIGIEETKFLQEMMRYIPEPINMVAAVIRDEASHGKGISSQNILGAINSLLEKKRSRFEEILIHYSVSEVKFLIALAKQEPVRTISGKAFLSMSGVSSAGVLQICRKLEADAMIYKEKEGYYLADPLLTRYLLKYR